ncbi:MAG TPA: DUF4139 domain-containing protein [Polyangia bacterium]|nr:DUF4139 domain-containing protein [Polyangia bacterium]
MNRTKGRSKGSVAGVSLLLAGSLGCATVPPVSGPGLSLKKVVIYRNGVGYFERGGHVDSDRVQFEVRKDEVGDFLATLAVLERGGSSVRSASFPLEVASDAPAPRPKAGEANRSTAAGAEKRELRHVVMALDGKEHDLQVGYIAQTPVWRPSYRLVIGKDGASLQTWGIVQNLSGEDWNDVRLSLVAEAPLAFDAALGIPVIPGRPTVTDGGDVMAVVPRSETSLAQAAPPPPPAMAAPMFGVGGGMASGAAAPRAAAKKSYARPMELDSADESADQVMAAPAPEAAGYSRETRNLAALAAISVQSGTTRYDLPATVSIPDKSSTMVMLADQRIPGQVVALYAPDGGVPDSARHPFRVARFVNKTGGLVERGPLAIFADGAFAGQGVTDALPDGATATVPFGLDRRVAVEVSRESRDEGSRLYHIEAGALTVARDVVSLTTYKLRNGAAEPATLLIKHPRNPGARMKNFPSGTEDNVGTGTALVPVQVTARGTIDLVLDERQQTTSALDWLSPLADEAVRGYLADRGADPAVARQLKAAWDVRRGLVDAQSERQKLAASDAELRRSTDETRNNLKALEKNTAAADLRAKLTARLADQSAQLDVVDKKIIETDLKINESQIRFTDAIRAVKLLQPLALE